MTAGGHAQSKGSPIDDGDARSTSPANALPENWTFAHFGGNSKNSLELERSFVEGGISMAAKPLDPDLFVLSKLADHAHKLLHEFVALPIYEQERAAELTAEFEHVVAEFKRLRPPPSFKGSRHLRPAETLKPRRCSICERPVDLKNHEFFQTECAIYHRACYRGIVDSE